MTILEALIQLRDDLKLWCINNFNKKAPAYQYGTEDLVAGESELPDGELYFVYEETESE